MARVLVPMGLDANGYNRGSGEINFARTPYLKKLICYGLTPVMLTPYATSSIVVELYSLCSGILLMGGDDIDAQVYGAQNHPANLLVDPRRDVLESTLVERGMADRKPILGICRGCQMLAVATGGTLHQHIAEIPNSLRHRVEDSTCYEDDLRQIEHVVYVDPQSRFRKIVGSDTVRTNSGHHQSIDKPGKCMLIAGRTSDGIVELIEHSDNSYFCFGVQAHPEAVEPSFLEQIFQAFAFEAEKYSRNF